MLCGPAGKSAAPPKMSSLPWSLCTGGVWWGQPPYGAGVKGHILGNVCETYGLAIPTKKPYFCWTTNAREGLQWSSNILKWWHSQSSSAWDASQGWLLSKHLGTPQLLDIAVWKSKAFFGWFQLKMRKSCINSQGFMGKKGVRKESVERKWKSIFLQFWITTIFLFLLLQYDKTLEEKKRKQLNKSF